MLDAPEMLRGFSAPPEVPAPAVPAGSVPWREIAALLAIVLLADLCLYRGQGYAGVGAFVAGVGALLLLGRTNRRRADRTAGLLGVAIAALALRLFWCGSVPLAFVAGAALVAFAAALAGVRPFLLTVIGFAFQAVAMSGHAIRRYFATLLPFRRPPRLASARPGAGAVLIPAAVASAFGVVFVLANPAVRDRVGGHLVQWARVALDWLAQLAPGEAVFCAAAAWLGGGLLRPWLPPFAENHDEQAAPQPVALAPQFAACRNTLATVIAVFAGYLAFEYATLWGRQFPAGFHYSGYAHEGAGWLTVALAMTTLTIAGIFRAGVLADPRVGTLRRLAWLWVVLNLLLAAAVFHRLFLYVGFNGMTRMRVVGFLGAATVVAGLLLAVRKATRGRRFEWLVRRQAWAAAWAVLLYFILPVDWWVYRWNVREILAGRPAPCVQITEHPLSDEALLAIVPLLDAGDATIRTGVAAMLHKRLMALSDAEANPPHWSARQAASQELYRHLLAERQRLGELTSPRQAPEQWAAFKKYAYQWY